MILIRSSGQATPVFKRPTPATRSVDLRVALQEWWQETCRLLGLLVKGKTLVTISLVVILVVSAVAAIYSVQLNRQLFTELQSLQSEKDRFEREWTQLLLEESAWSAHSRVEKIANDRFGMRVPVTEQLEIVR